MKEGTEEVRLSTVCPEPLGEVSPWKTCVARRRTTKKSRVGSTRKEALRERLLDTPEPTEVTRTKVGYRHPEET